MAVRREDQRLGAGAVGERVQVLAGQAVQPRQPVGTGDGEDVAVAAVDQARALGEQPLLAQRVAVVGRDRAALRLRPRRGAARRGELVMRAPIRLVRGTRGTSR